MIFFNECSETIFENLLGGRNDLCEQISIEFPIDFASILKLFCALSFIQGDIDGDGNRKSMEEIKKLQEELSALRQENIQLRVSSQVFEWPKQSQTNIFYFWIGQG